MLNGFLCHSRRGGRCKNSAGSAATAEAARLRVLPAAIVCFQFSLARKSRSLSAARGSSPQSAGRRMFMILLVYCIVSFNCICLSLCLVLALRDIFHNPMA